MGLRSKIKAIKRLLKDPQGWTEAHGSHMSSEYAKHGTPKTADEVIDRSKTPKEKS